MPKQITPEQIANILTLKRKHTTKETAQLLNLSYSRVRYWIRQLRKSGYTVHLQKKGRTPIINQLKKQK